MEAAAAMGLDGQIQPRLENGNKTGPIVLRLSGLFLCFMHLLFLCMAITLLIWVEKKNFTTLVHATIKKTTVELFPSMH